MLSDLNQIQDESSESIQHIDMSFDIETRDKENDEIVQRIYTFSYAKQWDTWTFQEYVERRTPDTDRVGDRDWRKSKELFWHDINETPEIDVPPEVSKKLAMATGSESVTIQTPAGHTVGESQ